MAAIDIEFVKPVVGPTICGPVSDFEHLTLSSNAISLGWMGFAAGIIASALFYVGVVYVAPFIYWLGRSRGWWS
ncbi:MAG: hypothetical protein EHM36_10945 [Deltaproteobacteria bacterium]|nr:MAG: hypothetical protein EHM36_10945 [Deltaproteobacteria bacterium]